MRNFNVQYRQAECTLGIRCNELILDLFSNCVIYADGVKITLSGDIDGITEVFA